MIANVSKQGGVSHLASFSPSSGVAPSPQGKESTLEVSQFIRKLGEQLKWCVRINDFDDSVSIPLLSNEESCSTSVIIAALKNVQVIEPFLQNSSDLSHVTVSERIKEKNYFVSSFLDILLQISQAWASFTHQHIYSQLLANSKESRYKRGEEGIDEITKKGERQEIRPREGEVNEEKREEEKEEILKAVVVPPRVELYTLVIGKEHSSVLEGMKKQNGLSNKFLTLMLEELERNRETLTSLRTYFLQCESQKLLLLSDLLDPHQKLIAFLVFLSSFNSSIYPGSHFSQLFSSLWDYEHSKKGAVGEEEKRNGSVEKEKSGDEASVKERKRDATVEGERQRDATVEGERQRDATTAGERQRDATTAGERKGEATTAGEKKRETREERERREWIEATLDHSRWLLENLLVICEEHRYHMERVLLTDLFCDEFRNEHDESLNTEEYNFLGNIKKFDDLINQNNQLLSAEFLDEKKAIQNYIWHIQNLYNKIFSIVSMFPSKSPDYHSRIKKAFHNYSSEYESIKFLHHSTLYRQILNLQMSPSSFGYFSSLQNPLLSSPLPIHCLLPSAQLPALRLFSIPRLSESPMRHTTPLEQSFNLLSPADRHGIRKGKSLIKRKEELLRMELETKDCVSSPVKTRGKPLTGSEVRERVRSREKEIADSLRIHSIDSVSSFVQNFESLSIGPEDPPMSAELNRPSVSAANGMAAVPVLETEEPLPLSEEAGEGKAPQHPSTGKKKTKRRKEKTLNQAMLIQYFKSLEE